MGKFLKQKYETLEEAEKAYNIDYFSGICQDNATPQTPKNLGKHQAQSPMLGFSPLRNCENAELRASILDVVTNGFTKLTERQRQQLLVSLFHKWLLLDINANLDGHYVPRDFLPLLGSSLNILKMNNKKNLLYHASRCFGQIPPGKTEPRMPLNRMPFGMISHNLCFFSVDDATRLQAPDDYKSWCQSMYTLFGNKWASMHCGPMWSYEPDDICSTTNETSSLSTSDVMPECMPFTFTTELTSTPKRSSNSLPKIEPLSTTTEPLISDMVSTDVTCTSLVCPSSESECDVQHHNTEMATSCTSLEQDTVHCVPSCDILAEAMKSLMSDTQLNASADTLPEVTQPSSLWGILSDAEKRENEGASISMADLEKMHGVRPPVHVTKNTCRDPLKVRYIAIITVCLVGDF